jgi:hypothetical protein
VPPALSCPICGIRKPRRFCPALNAEICTVCCATGREETIDCPVACEYLHEAHRHEHLPEYDLSKVPNQDIKITESFLEDNHILMAFISIAICEGATESAATTDWDVREAFETLIRRYRGLQIGLYVEERPANPYAAAVVARVQSRIDKIREKEKEQPGMSTIGQAGLLAVLAFLQRLEYSHNNGRKHCRAFIDFLGSFYKQNLPGLTA